MVLRKPPYGLVLRKQKTLLRSEFGSHFTNEYTHRFAVDSHLCFDPD
jgi:hypothetical protein